MYREVDKLSNKQNGLLVLYVVADKNAKSNNYDVIVGEIVAPIHQNGDFVSSKAIEALRAVTESARVRVVTGRFQHKTAYVMWEDLVPKTGFSNQQALHLLNK